MFLAAMLNFRTMRVPNALSLPSILAGWAVALLAIQLSVGGSIGSSLLATFAGSLPAYLLYNTGGLGAGTVKMQMAFGAWIGAALPLLTALILTLGACGVGLLLVYLLSRVRKKSDVGLDYFDAQSTFSLASIVAVLVYAWRT